MFPIFLHNHGIILYDFGVILKIKFSLSDCGKGVRVTKCKQFHVKLFQACGVR